MKGLFSFSKSKSSSKPSKSANSTTPSSSSASALPNANAHADAHDDNSPAPISGNGNPQSIESHVQNDALQPPPPSSSQHASSSSPSRPRAGSNNGLSPATPPQPPSGALSASGSSTGLASLNTIDAPTAAPPAPAPTRRGFLSGRSSKSSLAQQKEKEREAAAAAAEAAAAAGGGGVGAGSGVGIGPGGGGGGGGGGEIPTTQTILSNPLHPSISPSSQNGAGVGHPNGQQALPPHSNSTNSLSASSHSQSHQNLTAPAPSAGQPGSSSPSSSAAGIQLALPGDKHSRTFDVDDMISRLLDAGYTGKATKSVCLKNAEITAICLAAREVFLSQPTLIELSPPVKIVGDVHGQYSDLIRLFEMCGFPPQANFLFLGDYVDRGKQSLETILLLMCYKIKYPENFFLLRGNHECANVTRVYGFYDECKRRCNIKIWKTFIDVFNCLPICAIVASKIFCVHGGLSPSLTSMDDIRRISRPVDVPDYGLLNDLLWSDPSDTALDWEDNERGVSYCFGRSVIQEFLGRYDFDLICRAHMVVEDGYEFWQDRMLVTIFSAPNYCGEFQNFAAVMSVTEDLLCAFELLKPLDGPALKKEMARNRRRASGLPAAS